MMNKTAPLKYFIFGGIIALALLLFLKSCKGNFGGLFGGGKADTISIKHDTIWAITQGDTVYQPKPFSITNTNTIYRTIYKTDTLESTEVLPADTAAIVERFYQKVFYSDTQTNKYGKIVIDDTVYKNRIASRRVITDFKVPEVTNTVTLKQKRNVVYVGASAIGTIKTPLYAVGGDLSLKTKTDRMYTVGAYTTISGQVYYSAGYKVPIRFKRK
jgi:hypothetical protein